MANCLRSPSSNSFRGRFFVGAVGASVGFGDFAMEPSDNEEANWRAEFDRAHGYLSPPGLLACC
jgi:hypothetical protein